MGDIEPQDESGDQETLRDSTSNDESNLEASRASQADAKKVNDAPQSSNQGDKRFQEDAPSHDDAAQQRVSAENLRNDENRRLVRKLVVSKTLQGTIAIVAAAAGVLALAPQLSSLLDRPVSSSVVRIDQSQRRQAGFIVPSNASDLDRPPSQAASPKEIDSWRSDNNGVFAGDIVVRFAARSDLDEPSLITGIRVEVVDRKPPLAGVLIVPLGTGGEVTIRKATANVEASPPSMELGDSLRFPLKVSREDPELFDVESRVANCYCRWRFHLDFIDPDGNAHTEVVDDSGEPFAVTSRQQAASRVSLPENETDPWP